MKTPAIASESSPTPPPQAAVLSSGSLCPTFLDQLSGQFVDLSQSTKRAIRADLRAFSKWYQISYAAPLDLLRVTARDVSDFKRSQMAAGLTPETINRRLFSLRSMFRELVEIGKIQRNPTKGIRQLTRQKRAPKGLTRSELRQVQKEADLRSKARDILIIDLLVGTGLRVGEVTALTPAAFTLRERSGHVVVRHAKGGKTRTVPLHVRLRQTIAEHIKDASDDQPIFMGTRGPLGSTSIGKIVIEYAKRAGLNITAHALRHTFAYQYLKANPGDIQSLAQILGHSNINTTALYAQKHLDDLVAGVERMEL